MHYLTYLLLGSSVILGTKCSAPPAATAATHYQATLPPELRAAVQTYTRLAHFNKKQSAVILNWTAVRDGLVVYTTSTHSYPRRFRDYPLFWTYADSTLVFVYDNKYPNLLADSLSLKHEMATVIRTTGVALSHENDFVEDPLALRFLTVHGQQRIDTSNLYVRMCQ
jgi:hypothetical protein